MSWEKDPLVAKAKLFFGYAFETPREDPRFGLYSAIGLELLARGSLASISPTLLAEPDAEHKNLLHSLGRGADRVSKRSIGTSRVLTLCQQLFPEFTSEDFKSALALINRRNDELHTGTSAFAEYTTQKWIASFYRCCSVLATACGEDLVSVFGSDEANIAKATIQEFDQQVQNRILSEIAAHKKVFERLAETDRQAKKAYAKEDSDNLACQNHHRVICPACGSSATVDGQAFGNVTVLQGSDEIITKQAVMPERFACVACGLRLQGYSELIAAELGDQYTRRTTYLPEDYYGLVNPEDIDEIERLAEQHFGSEYNNE
jgi:hypothetical protein